MKTLYLDLGMGAAGDMLSAALFELLPGSVLEELNGLGIPGVEFIPEASVKCGITGTHMKVLVQGAEEGETHPHVHGHTGMKEIREIVSNMPAEIQSDVLAVYQLIAEAESHAHGVPVEQIHFHEVGTLDAVADISAVCLMLRRLAPEKIIASPIHVGSGTVRCAHGILPVPAPATAWILRGLPIYSGDIRGELCTPTGAALLKHFVTDFGPMPPMRVESIGYGMGKKDFPAANCLRAMVGRTESPAETVLELKCNVDDMTGEAVGFAMDVLLEAGALDVFTVPVTMKKSRPGLLITVLCREADREAMIRLLFRHTTTLGVREILCRREVLTRKVEEIMTPLGPVRRKDSTGFGVTRSKYEYEDLAELAKKNGISLADVINSIP